MSTSSDRTGRASDEIVQAVFTVRVCVTGLFLGGVIFWTIAVGAIPGPSTRDWTNVVIWGGFAALCLAAAAIVPRRFAAETDAQAADGSWRVEASDLTESNRKPPSNLSELFAWTYTTTTLMTAALLQAPVFFAAVLYMTGADARLAAGAAGFQVGVALLLPSRSRVEKWIRRRIAAVPDAARRGT